MNLTTDGQGTLRCDRNKSLLKFTSRCMINVLMRCDIASGISNGQLAKLIQCNVSVSDKSGQSGVWEESESGSEISSISNMNSRTHSVFYDVESSVRYFLLLLPCIGTMCFSIIPLL